MNKHTVEAVVKALSAYGAAARWDFSDLDEIKIQWDMDDLASALASGAAYTEDELLEILEIKKTKYGYEWK